MALTPKFVQITSTAVVAGNIPQLVLHALDENGQVWQWSAQHQRGLDSPRRGGPLRATRRE